YPYNWGALDYVNDYSMAPISIDGPFWIIVHTVVCEVVCQCSESTQNGGVYEPANNTIVCGDGLADSKPIIDFNAYPVPFDGVLNVEYKFEFDTNVTVEVFDIRGRLISTVENFNYAQGSLDTSVLDMTRANDQVYFIKMTTSRGVVVKKVVSSNK